MGNRGQTTFSSSSIKRGVIGDRPRFNRQALNVVCPYFSCDELIHHSDRGTQYLSIRYSDRLAEAGITASVGSVGDSYDNALAETINGLYKTEVIRKRGPWRNVDEVEYATLEWVDWFNNRRLLEPIGDIPPVEYEAMYYQNEAQAIAARVKPKTLRRNRGDSLIRIGDTNMATVTLSAAMFWGASLLSLVGFGIHMIAGQRLVMTPLFENEHLEQQQKWFHFVAWHGVSIFFFAFMAAFAYAALTPAGIDVAIAMIAINVAFALMFIGVGLKGDPMVFKFPGLYLALGTTALGVAGVLAG